jgi:uncharacterized protein YraI
MILKKTMIAAGVLVLSKGAALANPAVVTNSLNLRSGPSVSNGVIGVMPQGANVRAWNCGEGWCRVSYAGRVGYASERYLEIANAGPAYGSYAYAPEFRVRAYPSNYRAFGSTPIYAEQAYSPAYRDSYAYGPGYAYEPGEAYAYAPAYSSEVVYEPWPNPLAFPLFPWNW